MGIGYYNPLEYLNEPDELLTWSVPKHWTLEDASTVPLIYAQVRSLSHLLCNVIVVQGTVFSASRKVN